MTTYADRVVLVLAIAFVAWLYAYYWEAGQPGHHARVLAGNNEFQLVSLRDDQDIRIQGRLGVSRVAVREGKIRFIDSPCQGKQCVHSGWLAHSGEFTACLPNQISIQVLGSDPQFDGISF